MYRMSSDLAPYVTHPDLPRFHGQVAQSDAALAAFGRRARGHGIRLPFTPRKMIAHVGGVYGDHAASRARWIAGWEQCPDHVRRRLVLENDDVRFSAADALWIHERTGVRLVFDYQHSGVSIPKGVRPKIHFSSPRTGLREVKQAVRKDKAPKGKVAKTPVRAGARVKMVLRPPIWTGHADGLVFDVMLEGKAKDLNLPRLAPDVAARFGTAVADEAALEDGADAERAPDVDEGIASTAE